MLTVQPKISNSYGPAFSSRGNQECELTPEELEERKYYKTRKELIDQKEDLEEILDNDEFHLPKPAQTVIKGGAVITAGLLGGMATGWGAKKSIQAMKKIAKSAPMQKLKSHLTDIKNFIKQTKINFKKSDAYQKPAKAIKKNIDKFEKTTIGAPVVHFFRSVKKGVSNVYNAAKTGLTNLYNKLKGVNKEKYENAAANFVGASGGVASGVTALKEQDEAKDKE